MTLFMALLLLHRLWATSGGRTGPAGTGQAPLRSFEKVQAAPVIRLLVKEDVGAVVAACDWLFEPPGAVSDLWDPAAAEQRLLELCTTERSTAFVAHLDSRLIGFCTVYLDLNSLRYGQRASLNEIAVDPRYRSRGLGARLLHTAKSWARDQGATQLLLDSSTSRIDAHRFYRSEKPSFEAMCFGWRL
jgi:GNAT superfamily N-acetyltransferase